MCDICWNAKVKGLILRLYRFLVFFNENLVFTSEMSLPGAVIQTPSRHLQARQAQLRQQRQQSLNLQPPQNTNDNIQRQRPSFQVPRVHETHQNVNQALFQRTSTDTHGSMYQQLQEVNRGHNTAQDIDSQDDLFSDQKDEESNNKMVPMATVARTPDRGAFYSPGPAVGNLKIEKCSYFINN